MLKPKLLVVDIETAPAELWGWGMYNQNFGVDQVKADPYILMIGCKWVGDPVPVMFTRWEHGEQGMLQGAMDVINDADAIISKNGVSFDIPWIRTELAKLRMRPLRPLTHIDLQKVAKQYFRFLSNKLDYIGQYLGVGRKVPHEGFKLWRKVMEGDERARAKMVRYCIGDLRVTERTYHALRPFIENHPAVRAVGAEGCTKCHSRHTKKDGWRYTKCYRIQQHQCLDCYGYFSGKREKVA
jgi:hypothetical protein